LFIEQDELEDDHPDETDEKREERQTVLEHDPEQRDHQVIDCDQRDDQDTRNNGLSRRGLDPSADDHKDAGGTRMTSNSE
jgi:hypothetical protein